MITSEINQAKVGEVVSLNFNTAGVFQKYGIDFCCGGGVTVEKACQKHGLNVDKVTSELTNLLSESVSSDESYSDWSISFLIDYIVNTHHSYVRRKTEELGFYTSRVAEVHGQSHPENIQIHSLFEAISKEMQSHMASEEEVVFPLLKKIERFAANGEVIPEEIKAAFHNQIGEMENEHEAAGDLMKQIRVLSNGFTTPVDACTKYRILYQNLDVFEKDLHKHVHLENNVLFKKAAALVA